MDLISVKMSHSQHNFLDSHFIVVLTDFYFSFAFQHDYFCLNIRSHDGCFVWSFFLFIWTTEELDFTQFNGINYFHSRKSSAMATFSDIYRGSFCLCVRKIAAKNRTSDIASRLECGIGNWLHIWLARHRTTTGNPIDLSIVAIRKNIRKW